MGNGKRGTNPNSIKNLEKGRTKGKGRPNGTGGASWQDVVNMFLGMNPSDPRLLELAGLSKEDINAFCRVAGTKKITYKMLVTARAVRLFIIDGNAAILRELMQRSEPQDPLIMNIDLTKLSTEQLERLADGEDPRTVIFASAGGD